MKKLISFCFILCLFLQSAAALPAAPELHSRSAILMDSSGKVLFEHNADEQLPPASVTKIMTMLLAMEAVDSGRVNLTDMVPASANAASMGGTQIFLKEGERMSLDDMMKSIAVASANDAAVAVAEFLGGSEESFVDMMNKRAGELGMKNTTFVNPNGLDTGGKKTITSARDIALMSCELLKHPKIHDYTTIWMDTVRDGQFGLANTNKMLKSYSGMTGLKTGFTSEAKYCISATAQRDGMELIAAIMAAPTKEERTADATALLNYGFANFAKVKLDAGQELKPVPVKLGQKETAETELEGEAAVLTEKENAGNIRMETELAEAVRAPVLKGQALGNLKIYSGDKELLSLRIIAKDDIKELKLSDIYKKMLEIALMKR